MDATSIYDVLYTTKLHVVYLDDLGCSIRSTSLMLLEKCLLNLGYNAGVPPIKFSPHYPVHHTN